MRGYQVGFRRLNTATSTWTPWVYASFGPTARARTVKYPNGTTVQLLVRALNADGYGGWQVVRTVAGLPGRSASIKAVRGDRRVAVTWSAAPSNGTPNTHYRVHYRAYSGTTWTRWYTRVTTSAQRTTVFTGLINGRTYQFQVRAVNPRGVGPHSAAVTATPTAPPVSAQVARILSDTNAFRAAHGKKPLRLHPSLNTVAAQWAKHLHDTCTFVHRSSFSAYPSGWTRAGENIAAGYNYSSVVSSWINSPGHRANLLGNYTYIGIGSYSGSKCYRTYFVQNFATY